MNTTEPTLIRIEAQRKQRFYLGLYVAIGSFDFILFCIAINNGLTGLDPYQALTVSLISFLVSPLLFLGYDGLACSIVSAATYAHAWLFLLQQNQFIIGPFFITIITNFAIPMLHLFDRLRQKVWCVFIMVANVVLTLLYVLRLFSADEERILISAWDVKASMLVICLATTFSTGYTFHLNNVVSQVYDEVKRTNETIERSTRDKEQLFATISHEIRNPLQSLQGSVELVAELNKGDHERLRKDLPPLLEICGGCCGVVINLVSNILDMSKIAADKMQLNAVPTDLGEVVNRILRALKGRAVGKNIVLESDCDPLLPPAINVDPQRIEQVLVNLISNSIKFAPSKGRVIVKISWLPSTSELKSVLARSSWKSTMELAENQSLNSVLVTKRAISCSLHGLDEKYITSLEPSERKASNKGTIFIRQRLSAVAELEVGRGDNNSNDERIRSERGIVKIEVMDTGIGISKEGIQKLFKPYQQADSTISRKYGGTGLGLWITKNILLKMQGDIEVKSKPKRGSNFILAFPATVSDEVTAVTNLNEEGILGAEALAGKSYLLLDDIAENTFILSETLRRYGIRTTTCQNGIDALEMFKASRDEFNAIITDLRMPLMSGQTFIGEIRKFEHEVRKEKHAFVPIIVMTAEAGTEEKRLCLTQYGANEFLLKPVKLRDLVSALVRIHTAGANNKQRNNNKSILIVDDDAVGSGFMSVVLTKAGHRCFQAFSVREGISMIRSANPDVVVLDNFLGDGTGMDFMRKLAEENNNNGQRRRKVVSVSGNPVEEQKQMYEAGGFNIDGYLQKPASKQVLLGIVQIL